jgi:Tfp pilus assembly ATPase PilU
VILIGEIRDRETRIRHSICRNRAPGAGDPARHSANQALDHHQFLPEGPRAAAMDLSLNIPP